MLRPHECIKLVIPFPGCLLKTIQAFLKLAYQLLFAFLHKALRLLHVDVIMQDTMKKCSLDIHIVTNHVVGGLAQAAASNTHSTHKEKLT